MTDLASELIEVLTSPKANGILRADGGAKSTQPPLSANPLPDDRVEHGRCGQRG